MVVLLQDLGVRYCVLGILIEDLPELLVLWCDGPLQGKRGFDWKSWMMIQKIKEKG